VLETTADADPVWLGALVKNLSSARACSVLGITSETRVFLKSGFLDGRLGIEGLGGLVTSASR
jgi:hypothetical protein